MKSMDEIKTLRADAENQITCILRKLEKETGLRISEISFSSVTVTRDGMVSFPPSFTSREHYECLVEMVL